MSKDLTKEINKELAATVILEAAYTTDEIAIKKYGVSLRSLQRWRKSLSEDLALADVVRQKQEEFNRRWADEFPLMLLEAAQTLRSCFTHIRSNDKVKINPELIKSIAESVRLCGDVYLTSKAIDARIAPQDRSQGGLFGSDASAGAAERPN